MRPMTDQDTNARDKALLKIALNQSLHRQTRLEALDGLNDPQLVEQVLLGDQDIEVRQAALDKLKVAISHEAAVALALNPDAYPEVRAEAIEQISDVAVLDRLAADPNEEDEVRVAAMSRASQSVADEILADHDENPELRAEAIGRASQELLEKIASDKSEAPEIQSEAILSLENPKPLEAIITDVTRNARIRAAAAYRANALGAVDQKLLEGIVLDRGETVELRRALMTRLAREEVVDRLALDKGEDYELRLCAADWTKSEKVVNLLALDRSENPEIRLMAINNNVHSEEVLTRLLDPQENEEIRHAAVREIEDEKMLSHLALDKNEKVSIRVEALGGASRKAIEGIALDTSEVRNVRLVAIGLLDSELTKKIVLDPNEDQMIRNMAALSLGIVPPDLEDINGLKPPTTEPVITNDPTPAETSPDIES